MMLCACGRPKTYGSRRCRTCEKARRRGPILFCEWCKQEFWRHRSGSAKTDARRFCSKRCSGLQRTAERRQPFQQPEIQMRQALALEQLHEHQRQRRQLQEQELEQRLAEARADYQERTKCACGAPSTKAKWTPTHPYMRRWCEACFAQ